MKKFLSLVMALVMTMSLVTISAGAKDFADDSKITYKEAVDVVSAVKIVDGYTDGSFNPSATLTRGAAAKIICNMILGPTTAGALVADAAPFKDVPANSTFAGYIAYCSKEGIISGYADGTFKPGNTLTGYAFMKMLLGALGYDKANEGYEGANWSINVAKRALNIGLDKGLTDDFNGIKPVTREEAALYAFNTLKATMVQYINASTITVGDITVQTNVKASEINAGAEDYGTGDGKLQFCEKYFSKLKLNEDATDTYGRPANEWKYKNDKVGTYAKEADATYTANTKLYQVNRDLGMGTSDDAYFYYTVNAGKTVAHDVDSTGVPVYVDYYQSTTSDKLGDLDVIGTYVGNGVTVEVFYEDKAVHAQNKIVVIDEYFGEVKEVKSDDDGKYVTLKNEPGTRKFYTEDFAKGDKVLYTIGANSATEYASMTAAEKLTGKLETVTSKGEYVIDGTSYKVHGGEGSGVDVDAYAKAGDTVDFYLDSNGYIIKLDITEASSAVENLVLFTDFVKPDWDVKGKAIYGSGKTGTEVLKDVANTTDVTSYYIYSASTSASKVKLSTLNDHQYYYGFNDVADQGYYFTKGSTKITGCDGVDNYVQVNSKTTFVYVDETNNTVKTYVGHTNAPTFEGANAFAALWANNASAAKLVYVFVDGATVSSKVTDLLYVVANDYALINTTNADGDAISYYEAKTVTGDTFKISHAAYDETTFTNYKNAGVVVYSSISKDENGIIDYVTVKEDSKAKAVTVDTVIEENDGVLYFDGVGEGYDEKVTVYEIDAEYNVSVVDITGIDDTYAGYTWVKNDDGMLVTVVLKCK